MPGEAWPGPSPKPRGLPGHSSLSYLCLIFQSQLLSGLDKVLVCLEKRGQAPLPSLEIYLAIVRCDTDRFQRFSNPTRQVAVLDDSVMVVSLFPVLPENDIKSTLPSKIKLSNNFN
jgi:hypothetical protein